jgi:hypothetical protein
MGTPINTPLTSEIWHLTIDDLLEPLSVAPRLGGPGPFVINLSASTAPISVPMKAVAEHPGAHVYQIQRTEDRRVRYRLRLGPFETEAEAEALLSAVREIYPSAFSASAEAEDLRSIEAIKNKIEAQQLAAVKAAVNKAAAAPLANGRPGPARATQPEAPEPPPSASADGEALPTSPPPAWLALRATSPPPAESAVEIDFAAPSPQPSKNPPADVQGAAVAAPAKSVRGFAPARWSPTARAFVPSVDFASAPGTASASAPASAAAPIPVPKSEAKHASASAPASEPALASSSSAAKAHAPAAVSTPAAATGVPARPATPGAHAAPGPGGAGMAARPAVPMTAGMSESLIPVLCNSMAVPRATPAARPILSPAAALQAGVPSAHSPLAAAGTARAAVTAPAVSTAPAAAQSPIVTTAAPIAPPTLTVPPTLTAAPSTAAPSVTAPPTLNAPSVLAPPPTVTAPPTSTAPPPPVVTPRPVAASAVSPRAATGATPAGKSLVGTASSPAPARRMTPAPLVAAARRTQSQDARVENFDTTQTLRPLTPTELEDPLTLRWFVIQLSCSEEAFDPDSLPNLDIFSEYRLYSVASFDQGKLLHSLRVGFFSEESHAKAVAGYLGTFYANPTVKRVSTAERTRFAQHRVEARKDIGATGKHAIIEITDERVIRPKRSGSSTVPPMRPPLPTPPTVRGR